MITVKCKTCNKLFRAYPYEFNNELKLAIKIREKHKCYICKKKECEIQKLHIHHIDYNKQNNEPSNLVALCPSCHIKTNRKRRWWIKYFDRSFNIEKEYISINEIQKGAWKIYNYLKDKKVTGIVPILRGGMSLAILLYAKYNIPLKIIADKKTDVFVEDIVDYGHTVRRYKKKYPNNLFVCLHVNKRNFKLKDYKPDYFCRYVTKYVIYPWEPEIVDDVRFKLKKLKAYGELEK